MAIVVVGSVALDTITVPSGTFPQVLGGSATYFALAARHFTSVCIVAAVGQDFPGRSLRILRQPGIELGGLATLPGNTFRWSGRYSDDLATRRTTGLKLGVFQTFRPRIPASHRLASCVFLANIDPRLQRRVLAQVGRPRLVAVDTIDHWITHERQALLRLLRASDMVLLNEEEARLLTQQRSLGRMGAWLRRHGPTLVIIKQGRYGAVGWMGSAMVWVPAYPTDATRDPTGAGDAFAGGVLGCLDRAGRITPSRLRCAMLYGSVIGSFCVEDVGVSGLRRLTSAALHQRLDDLRRFAGLAD